MKNKLFGQSPKGSSSLRAAMESLETRQMLTANLISGLPDITRHLDSPETVVDLNPHFYDHANPSTVRLTTNLGNIDIHLTNNVTPNTVANFLKYVNQGRYNGTIFHRLAYDSDPLGQGADPTVQVLPKSDTSNLFVLQGGGFTWNPGVSFQHIATDAPVADEVTPGVTTNLKWTISMAKSGPNTATSEFFINLRDNTFLDTGANFNFAAFGSIDDPASQAVVDAITGLKRIVDFFNTQNTQIQDSSPLVNYSLAQGQITKANFVTIESAVEVGDPLTYSVTSSNPALVAATIDSSNQLRLNFGTDLYGSSTITVTAKGPDNVPVQTSFTATVTPAIRVVLGGSAPRKLRFTDADGSKVTLKVSKGIANIIVTGTNPVQSTSGNAINATGADLKIESFSLAGNGGSGSIDIQVTGGNKVTTIGSMTLAEGIGQITASRVDIEGTLAITGKVSRIMFLHSADKVEATESIQFVRMSTTHDLSAGGIRIIRTNDLTGTLSISGSVSSVEARKVTGGTINLTRTSGVTSLNLGSVTNGTITSSHRIGLLKVHKWLSGGSISGTTMASLVSDQDFTPSVTLRSGSGRALDAARVGGSIDTGTWNITGDVGTISAAKIAKQTSMTVSGHIHSFKTRGSMTNLSLTAASVGGFTVGLNLSGANIDMTAPLASKSKSIDRLVVGRVMDSSTIHTLGNIGAIRVGSKLTNTIIYAGVNVAFNSSNNLIEPTSLASFVQAARIGSVFVPSSKGTATFANNIIAGRFLGQLSLGTIGSGSAVHADKITSIVDFIPQRVVRFGLDASTDHFQDGGLSIVLH